MKNILVLTDFSKNSANAAEFGLMLSGKLNTNLLLFNTYVTNAAVSFVGKPWIAEDLIWGEDDSKDCLNKLASQLKTLAGQFANGDYKPAIYCDNGEGKLGTVVPDIIHKQNIEMVIMGARSENPDDDNIFGSDLNAVIQKSSRPILVIPSKISPDQLKKVIFATDFDKSDISAIHYLVNLKHLLNFELEIIHITDPEKAGIRKILKEATLEEQVGRLDYPQVTYHEIKGNDVVENIMRIYNESGAGLLAIVHHQQSFIMRLFHQSVTKRVLENQQVPLMIFPSTMK